MDGDVLVPLKSRYYWTLETNMTVTEPLASQEPRLFHSGGTRRFIPHTRTKYISITTMIMHTTLLLCTQLYCSDQFQAFAECIFYALQVRTRTIKGFVCTEKYFHTIL